MVILQSRHFVGKAEGGGELDLVFRFVLPVPAPALSGDKAGRCEGPFPRDLGYIVHDAVFIAEIGRLKFPVFLHPEAERDTGVYHSLLVQNIPEVFLGNVDIREHLPVRPPADGGAGLFPVGRRDHKLLSLFSADLALFKMELVLVPVAPDRHIHIF